MGQMICVITDTARCSSKSHNGTKDPKSNHEVDISSVEKGARAAQAKKDKLRRDSSGKRLSLERGL